MIPIHDNVRSRTFPFVNVTLIAINVAVFFYELWLAQDQIAPGLTELDRFIFDWGNIPACAFDALGWDQSLSARATQLCAQQPQPVLSVFTAMFIHGGWLHLIGNMLFLFIFGDNVEDSMGHVLYAIFYLLVGVIAAAAHGLIGQDDLVPAIGASGAIAGVMGAYIVLFPRATVAVIIPIFFFIPFPLPAFLLIGVWFLFQVFTGVAGLGVEAVGASGGVAYFAHVGGFVAGAILVNLFAVHRGRSRPTRPRRREDFW